MEPGQDPRLCWAAHAVEHFRRFGRYVCREVTLKSKIPFEFAAGSDGRTSDTPLLIGIDDPVNQQQNDGQILFLFLLI